MEKYSIREVIEQAVQTEKLGYQFYTSTAERFEKDEGLKKLFSFLATKELRHEKTFRELLEIIKDPEPVNWEEAEPYLRAIVESEFFLGKNKSLPSMQRLRSVEDAVNFALGFEKETLLYFYWLRDAVKEKEVVDEIINEERSHIMWLNRFRESFKK
ncbi:MAG TPA: ferritin family protein [Thermodesulfovibrionales bacterium]|nr:ferritin family protein [Thermodesulfovibrionales bacterium]